jgi:hypothetical protein
VEFQRKRETLVVATGALDVAVVGRHARVSHGG